MFRDKKQAPQPPMTKRTSHARIISMPDKAHCLDTVKLNQMEQSFRTWAEGSPRADVHLSRKRVLLIFLLIRYTGAKLNEEFALNPFHDIDFNRRTVVLGRTSTSDNRH